MGGYHSHHDRSPAEPQRHFHSKGSGATHCCWNTPDPGTSPRHAQFGLVVFMKMVGLQGEQHWSIGQVTLTEDGCWKVWTHSPAIQHSILDFVRRNKKLRKCSYTMVCGAVRGKLFKAPSIQVWSSTFIAQDPSALLFTLNNGWSFQRIWRNSFW